MTNPSAFILADISARGGTGQFWRCARLADQLANRDCEVTLLMPDNPTARTAAKKFLTANNTDIHFRFTKVIQDHPPHIETFAPLDDKVLHSFPKNTDIAIIDSHRLSPHHMEELSQHTRSLYVIDDYKHRDFYALDGAFHIINPCFKTSYNGIPTLCPPDYHLLPAAFFDERQENPDLVISAFSGVDKGQVGISLYKEMYELDSPLGDPDLQHVLYIADPKPWYAHAARKLTKQLGDRLQIVSWFDAARMFRQASMGVCTGGQMSFEMQAAGCPIASIAAISDPSYPMGKKLNEKYRVPFIDLRGVLDSHINTSKPMRDFAEATLNAFHKRSAIKITPPHREGLANLVNFMMNQL